MLIEFEVENYRSFHAPVRLSMVATKPIKEFEGTNVFTAGRYRLLKSAVLYGANASGKSNFLDALVFMRHFILNSSKETQAQEPIDVVPFKLDVDSEKAPSYFQLVFLIDGLKYRYGFWADRKAVRSEWLFCTRKVKETPLFLREGEGIEVKDGFPEGRNLEEKTRDNALFLSVAAQFNGKIAGDIVKWLNSLWPIHGLRDQQHQEVSIEMLKHEDSRRLLVEMVRRADLGIDDLQLSEKTFDPTGLPTFTLFTEEGKKRVLESLKGGKIVTVASSHTRLSRGRPESTVQFDFDSEESEGTKKFFRIAGPILDCLRNGRIAVIDELDARLHPLLTRALIRLFHSIEANPRNSQLIFGTHDTNLLCHGEFRRDQVWFTEKNQQAESDLYSLVEIKLPMGAKVRKDASYEKDYIRGRYGAIPFLGDFTQVFRKEAGNG